MIRSPFAVSLLLLVYLATCPVASAQEAAKPSPVQVTAKPLAGDQVEIEATTERLSLEFNELVGPLKAQDLVIVDDLTSPARTPGKKSQSTFTIMTPAKQASVKGVVNVTKTVSRPFDALWVQFGFHLAEADETLRAQLELPKDQGVLVVAVKPDTPAEKAGFQWNDIILSLGDLKVSEVAQARKKLMGLGDEALEVKLIREGSPEQVRLVGIARTQPADPADYWIGVPVSPVDGTLRAHLPALPRDSGLVVNDVVKGSPAELAALLKNDILVAMGEKPLKDSASLIEQVKASEGKPVPLKLIRGGKVLTLTITPVKRSWSVWVDPSKAPGTTLHYEVVQPYMTVDSAVVGKNLLTNAQKRLNLSRLVQATESKTSENSADPKKPTEIRLQLSTKLDDQAARLEAQMKEVMMRLDAISKALEGLKKPRQD